MFMIWCEGLGFSIFVLVSRFRVSVLRFRFRVESSGFRVRVDNFYVLVFRVLCLGFMDYVLGFYVIDFLEFLFVGFSVYGFGF